MWFNPQLGGSGNFIVTNGQGYQPGGGPWVAYSDQRIKKDIADYTIGLDAITRLRPITYRFNGRGVHKEDDASTPPRVGLVADEVEDVMPEMVGWDRTLPEPLKTLNTNAITYALINAVKTLDARLRHIEESAHVS